jgi:hypothetical protein
MSGTARVRHRRKSHFQRRQVRFSITSCEMNLLPRLCAAPSAIIRTKYP